MRASARIAATAGGAILLWAGLALAQEAKTVLPDVNVTAPVTPPPRFSAASGKTRVEEEKWPEIPCATSRIATGGAAGKCQNGPKVENFMSGASPGAQPSAASECTIHHHLVSVDVGRFAVEADILVLDPYKVSASLYFNKFCFVWSGFTNLPEDFKDLNQVARRGVEWRNFVSGGAKAGAQSTMEFSDGQRGCAAVERLGPQWRGGYVWVVHATICRAGPPPIFQDIDTVFSALEIRTYDPTSNLRPPPG